MFYSASNREHDLLNSFEFVEKKLDQVAISASVNVQRKQHNSAYQLFTKDGPIALLPVQGNEASVVWSLEKNSSILKLQQNDLENQLNDYLKNMSVN